MLKKDLYSEMAGPDGVRPAYSRYKDWYDAQGNDVLDRKAHEAEAFFRSTGITFNVYGQSDAEERLIPFDNFRKRSLSFRNAGL